MSSLNLYDTAIGPVIGTLRALSVILKKGESHLDAKCLPHSTLLKARIAPDMHPLPYQVQVASNLAKFIAVRIADVPNEFWIDDEDTFADLHDRVAKTIAFLERVDREWFDKKEDVEITLRHMKFTGLSYVTVYSLPNFYFHAVTIYNLLRMSGVEIGKKDWLQL
ncbi:uncharacterized protein AB675_7434 [Cyphellophora attinorum]|uniref:DUF1993 domain-containing protein n=1 Tax=Cyphellophora attinorum TaxID=1664694 RepID=A0A0N0NMK3_9EURO|nr:uncharacterized protein AB675_7434 [Phialophora attinorum]KPI40561.1 hypothetical protein AB675_7434 [Phialophora attinorum]